MDDKTFLREKVRRELQEAVAVADEATVAANEGDEELTKRKDMELALKLLQLNIQLEPVGRTLLDIKDNA